MERIFKQFGKNSHIEEPSRIYGEDCIVIGDDVQIGAYSWIQTVETHHGRTYNPYLEIGSGCNIGRYAVISANNHTVIGKNVLMSERVYISDHIHEYGDINIPIIYQPASPNGHVIIEDDCWLGIGCCILRNVTIGRHSVVGANTVVRKDVPPYSVVAGDPAKVILVYNFKTNKWQKTSWWRKILNS